MLFWIELDACFFLLYLYGMYSIKDNKYINLLAFFLMACLTVITVIREGVWTDYYSYVSLYYANYDLIGREPLFKLINDILHYFNGSSQMMFLVYGVAINFIFWKSIRYYIKDAKERLTAVLLFESFSLMVALEIDEQS